MGDLNGRLRQTANHEDADAVTVLGWGLRHYWWIFLLSVCALGLAVPLVLERTPETYEAQAQVGPSGPLNLSNIDPLPRLGDSLFRNGSVAEEVRGSFDPPLPASEDVIPERVSLITAQDNVVLTVVGHAATARGAASLANVAAQTLRDQLNNYDDSVGTFTIQRYAAPPGKPVSRVGRPQSVAAGVLAGLLVALGIVGLLLLRRRPVLGVGSAESASGARVLGQVWLGRTSDEARGLPQFCHALLSTDPQEVLLVGAPRTGRQRGRVTRLLAEVLAGRRDVTSMDESPRDQPPGRAEGRPAGGGPRLLVAQDASQSQLVGRPDQSVVVLVAPYGIGRSSLVRQVEQYLDGGPGGVLLVKDRRRRGGPGRRKGSSRAPVARAVPQADAGINGTPRADDSSSGATQAQKPLPNLNG